MSEPTILTLDPQVGLPALVHPGRGRLWWRLPDGWAWSDGERLWVAQADRVVFTELTGAVDVEPLERGGVIAWNDAGEVVVVRDPQSVDRTRGPRPQAGRFATGLHTRAFRGRGSTWRAWTRAGELELPAGARRARHLVPFRRGDGVCWIGDGWVVRLQHDAMPRALGEVADESVLAAGPHGAALIGDGERWTAVAMPNRSLRELPEPLVESEWGVRWSADGRRLAGLDDLGDAVFLDLAAGTVVRRVPDALPVDAHDAVLPTRGDALLTGSTWRPRETSWARSGLVLGGPGAQIWDLQTGRPQVQSCVLAFGASVATPAGWATVDWESGRGRWFDPLTGTRIAEFVLPLDAHDTVVEGWAHDGGAAFSSAHGHTWWVQGSAVRPTEASPPEPARVPEHPLAFEGTATIQGRVWGWNDDGLLVVRASV